MIRSIKTPLSFCLLTLVSIGLTTGDGGIIGTRLLPSPSERLFQSHPSPLPYFALGLYRQFEGPDPFNSGTQDLTGMAADTGTFRYPEINSEEFRLGYGMEPPSIGEQLLYSVGLILLQAGGSRLEAATR
ncbi:MAG TPA: hypothetical protein PLV45_01145 [bacterium]|nr:hypothetical protein [bacterium]